MPLLQALTAAPLLGLGGIFGAVVEIKQAMQKYIVKRLLLAIPTILGAATLVWIAMQLAPGNPAVHVSYHRIFRAKRRRPNIWKQSMRNTGLTTRCRCNILRYMGNTLQVRFRIVFAYAAPGNGRSGTPRAAYGSSWRGGLPLALDWWWAYPLGILAAIKRATWTDGALMVSALVGRLDPQFLVCLCA